MNSLEKPTGATVAETIKERVGPITLSFSVQRQALRVGVGGNLHSRVSLHESSELWDEMSREQQTVGWVFLAIVYEWTSRQSKRGGGSKRQSHSNSPPFESLDTSPLIVSSHHFVDSRRKPAGSNGWILNTYDWKRTESALWASCRSFGALRNPNNGSNEGSAGVTGEQTFRSSWGQVLNVNCKEDLGKKETVE